MQYTFLQLPIPGSELEILLQEVYTFGGPGGESTAPGINDVSPRSLRAKANAMEFWRLSRMERADDTGRRR